jgi:cytochrome c oxidase subunit II
MVRFGFRLAAAIAALGAAGYVAAVTTTGPGRIELTAKKFAFSSAEIRVKKGKSVTFALTAVDFVHGFSIPDFNARIDLVPGKTVELTITPDKAGKFIFLCDNFCGEGHEHMNGVLVVTDD